MNIKGQDKLIALIDQLTLDTFPRSLLLEGLKGSGKSLIINYIAKHINLDIIDISENLTFDAITEYSLRSDPYVYLISKKLSIKEQNVILKFLEEPPKNAFIIIECENSNTLLPTILNRCISWKLAEYSKDVLESFISGDNEKETLLDVCKTPGDVINFNSINIAEEIKFIDKIFSKINKANYANALTLSKHIRLNNEQDKISLEMFTVLLKYVLLKNMESNASYSYAIKDTLELSSSLNIPNIDKKYLFETYITNLWESARREYGT